MSLSTDTTLYTLYNSLFEDTYGSAHWGVLPVSAASAMKPPWVVINNVGEASKYTMDGNELETELFQLTVFGDANVSRTKVVKTSEAIREALTNQANLTPDALDAYPYTILGVIRESSLPQMADDSKSWSVVNTYRVISERS